MIEDTPPGIEAGYAAGARTVGLTTTFPGSALPSAYMIVEHLDDLMLQRAGSTLLISVR